MEKKNYISLSVAIIIAFFMLSYSIKNIFVKPGIVVVKGSSEKYVVADKVIWNISFVNSGNNLAIINEKILRDTEKTKNFLKKFNLNEEEINLGQLEFVDMDSREYKDPNQKNRFILTQNIYIESNNVDAVEKASKNLLDLVKENVYLKDSYNGMKPIYLFTKLNEIKNSMIDESALKAKISAKQFAKNSNTKIGKIKSANQGLFIINGRNKGDLNGEMYQKEKEVRVVSTFEYYLN